MVIIPLCLLPSKALGQGNNVKENYEYKSIKDEKSWFKVIGSFDKQVNYDLLDSLKKATTIDEKNRSLKKLAHYNIHIGNADSILYYGNSIKDLLENNQNKFKNFKKQLSETHNIIALGNTLKGLYDESIKNNLLGIEISQSINDSIEYYTHQVGLAKNYALKKNFNKAITIYTSCLKSQNLTKKNKLEVYKGIANIHLDNENYNESSIYYNKALDLLKEVKNLKEELEIKINLGFIEEAKKNYKKALNSYEEIKTLTLQNNFYDLYIDSQNRMGIVYAKIGDYESAKIILSTTYINAVNWNKLDQQRKLLDNLRKLFLSQRLY